MVLLIIVRLLIVIGLGLYYYQKFVWNYSAGLAGTEGGIKEDNDDIAADEKNDQKQAEVEAAKTKGSYMYFGLLSYFYTGGYRLLPAKDFRYEILIGYAIEIVTLIFPMLYCLVNNNSATDSGVDLTAL